MSILAEILREMYVDPELLEQLSMEQRDVLFRKMREEQVRRWQAREAQLEKQEKRRPRNRTKPKVHFLAGTDGNPWVWVMGDHKDDLSYEELVRKREQEELEKEKLSELQLRKEAEELAKKETLQIMSLAKTLEKMKTPLKQRIEQDSVDDQATEESTSSKWSESEIQVADAVQQSPQVVHTNGAHNAESQEQRRRRTLTKRASMIGFTNVEQRQYEKKRADEVFSTLLRAKRLAKRRAQEIANRVEEQWKESERRAKRYEMMRRSSFKAAREMVTKNPDVPEKILEQIPTEKKQEIVRRMSVNKPTQSSRPYRKAPPPPDRPLIRKTSVIQPGTKPKSFSKVVNWFRENEAPRGVGKERDGSISIWFHGKLTRGASQKLLESKPEGSYLIRLSSEIWGYTLSVKSYEGVKHFLIDASNPEQYCLKISKQQSFKTIPNLLSFYKVNPVTWAGQEVLLIPIGQEDELPSSVSDLFQGLYFDLDDVDTISEEITEM